MCRSNLPNIVFAVHYNKNHKQTQFNVPTASLHIEVVEGGYK